MDCVFRTSSDLSVKSGTIFVDKIPQIAKEKGFNAVGITDFMNLFGFIKFYKSCLKNEVKPIIGVEILLINEKSEKYKILIYAKNYTGLREIFKIISDAYISEREADSDVAIEEKYFFDNYNFENIIIFSGGVFGFASLSKNINDFENYLLKYKNKFKDDFYIEINRFQSKLYNINDILLNSYNLSKKLDIKLINSQPIFFEKKEDFLAHSIRVSAIKNEKLNKSNLNKIDGDYTYDMYFKSKKEIDDLFFDLKDCLNTTETEILNKINIEIKLGFNDLPIYKTPNNESIEVFFRNKSYEGLENRMRTYFSDKEYLENKESYIKRLDYEIDTIINMKFVGYFLIVADFINWAKNNDIPVGPGRGSGAGSLVAYSLGITDLNPIPYDLLFERFLNPERVSMPDFDIDFCQEKRDLVIQYVQEKYGKEAVAQIMTNGTMASRSVIKDVARVLGLPYVLADNITQKINMTQSLEEAYNEELPENLGLQKMIDRDEVGTEIWDNALKLEGVTKSIGKHAAGILIAPNKIIDYSPLYHSDGLPVSQLDKNDVEEAGLVKFDFLGLRNLTIIHYCLKMIKKVRNINFKIESNFNDDKTYKLLENANTTAVFQLESFGMKKYLKKMKPDCFEDIIAILALYRPGPLGSGMVDSFIKRKNWEKSGKPPKETTLNFDLNYEVSDYFTQALEECLKPTYGIIVYQEQVMKISQIIAGYSLGGADLLRLRVSGDSMIYVDKIGNIKVSELYNNYKNQYSELFLPTLNETTKKIELDKINDVFYSGQKETFKVIFKSGREINITKDHPILTFDGWKELEKVDLKNDFIALTTKIHKNSNDDIINNSNILWDQIKSIESNGIEMVYDISMCKNHNFIINDVIVHNCMGKKKPEEMAKQRGIFNEGALKNGYSLELATHLFDLMEKFAEYGFNKSHSAAYAVITYQTAFLKAHYPIEFMAATLMSEEHDTEKINILIEDCKFNNIKVNNPDINDSEIHFTPTLSEIKYSLSALKGIGIDIAKEIVKERKENGLYTSFENFCSRNVKILNKKSLSSLIRSGCFDQFSNNRAKYFFSIDDVLKQKQKILSQRLESVSLFEEYNNEKIYLSPDYDKHNWTIIEKIENEILGIGFELTTNLYVKYKEKIESLDDGSISPSYFENKNNLFILMSNQHMKKNEFILYGVIKDHIDNSSPQLIIKDDSSFIKCSIVYSLVRGKYKLIKESLLNNRFIKCKISVYIKKDENNEDNEYKLFFNITEIYDVFD